MTFRNSVFTTLSDMSINRHDSDQISFKYPSRAHIKDLIQLTGQLKGVSVRVKLKPPFCRG